MNDTKDRLKKKNNQIESKYYLDNTSFQNNLDIDAFDVYIDYNKAFSVLQQAL